jgi:acylphosphatase
MIRWTCFLVGRVQGVGMRFAVRDLAEEFPLFGYVENLEDGRVCIVVEGEAEPMQRFLDQLRVRAPGHLHSIETYQSEASGEFANFSIRR